MAAEFIAKAWIQAHGYEANVLSRATSREEIGNDVYPPMKRALASAGVPYAHHSATQITDRDVDEADVIFYMDEWNYRNLVSRCPQASTKATLITEGVEGIEGIEDPWYTGRFDMVVAQLKRCIDYWMPKLVF